MKVQIKGPRGIKIHFYMNLNYFLVYSFFVLTLIYYLFSNNDVIQDIRMAFLIFGAIQGYRIAILRKFYSPVWLAIFWGICWLLCLLFQTTFNSNLYLLLYTLSYIGFSVLLLESSFDILGSAFLLIVCAGTILIRYLLGWSDSNILREDSRNYISVLILFTLILYYLSLRKHNIYSVVPILLPALIFFGICVPSYGRGGILTAGFLLIALSVFCAFNSNNKNEQRGLGIFVFFILVVVIFYLIFSNQISMFLGKFNVSVVDDARITFWEKFFTNNMTSLGNFIWGSDMSLTRPDLNLHNSFLQCYGLYGLIGFCVLILLCIRAIINGLREKDFLWVILAVTLFLRSFTDKLFFQGYNELFLFYFLMYWGYKKHEENRKLFFLHNAVSDYGSNSDRETIR